MQLQDGYFYLQFIILMQEEDQLRVEDTNEEALASKISAIKKGYFVDNYAEQFTQYRGKRDIIIHRGYWARVHIVRKLIESIIAHGQNVQIIALGSGLETTWFNLMDQGKINKQFRFIELDLQSVVKKKIKKINNSKKLKKLFAKLNLDQKISEDQNVFQVGQLYTIATCDLSNIQNFQKILSDQKIDTTRPTLIYCQCVLSYIDSDRVDELVAYVQKQFNLAFFFDYEMYNPNDRFGQLMVRNFKERGCPLIGIYKYPELSDQHLRYTAASYKRTEVLTMLQIYNDCIDKAERQAIEKIQMLDEYQEWNLIMAHYFGVLSVTYNEEGEKHANFKELLQKVKLKH